MSEDSPPVVDGIEFSKSEPPFVLEERSAGITFVRTKEWFHHPYALLKAVRWREGNLRLSFAELDVEVTGRGLQTIFDHVAAHRLARLIEQGERYAAVTTGAVQVSRITECPRTQDR